MNVRLLRPRTRNFTDLKWLEMTEDKKVHKNWQSERQFTALWGRSFKSDKIVSVLPPRECPISSLCPTSLITTAAIRKWTRTRCICHQRFLKVTDLITLCKCHADRLIRKNTQSKLPLTKLSNFAKSASFTVITLYSNLIQLRGAPRSQQPITPQGNWIYDKQHRAINKSLLLTHMLYLQPHFCLAFNEAANKCDDINHHLLLWRW